MTAFDKAWDVAKYDDDPECGDCETPIPNGNQYGCEVCGKDICEECMTNEEYGYPGYRGDMDDDIHPAYNDVMSQSGAHCPECASKIVEDYDDEQKERMEEEAEEEALRQLEEASIRNDQNELDRKLSEQPFFGDNRGKMLGQNESPHFHSKFHPDWQDLNRSKDSFESAWGIAKAAPIDECKGCGLAHGTPNSEYCSEICEMQNTNKKVQSIYNRIDKAADWDTSFKPNATWSQEDIDRLNARNDKIRQEMKDNPPVPSDADHMAARDKLTHEGMHTALDNSWRATGPKRDVLADALSRARRENAKPKPKMRITRPDDW